jgi:hypothetical protein
MRLHACTGSFNLLELFRTSFYRYSDIFHDCFSGVVHEYYDGRVAWIIISVNKYI